MARRVDDHGAVFARFVRWQLALLIRFADPKGVKVIEQIRALYGYVAQGQMPSIEQWAENHRALSGGTAAPGARHAAELGYWTFSTARYAREAQQQTAIRLVEEFAFEIARDPEPRGQWTDWEAWQAAQLTLKHYAYELAFRRLLIYLQLEQPPRNGTERALQEEVRQDERFLPVYCDYLEDLEDPIFPWLRTALEIEAKCGWGMLEPSSG